MSIWEHSRFRIFNQSQHPYSHTIDDFVYTNPRIPGSNKIGDVLDYIVASIYPNYIGTFATQQDLPVSANSNDYAIVSDDGDGKSAGYIWLSLDGTDAWQKKYDENWSAEGILAEAVNRTMPMYVSKYGFDDKDAAGADLTGTSAGQHIFGGKTASTHLTLHANSGDTAGAHTGYIQLDDSVRPLADDAYSLGTPSLRFSDVYAVEAVLGDLVFQGAAIDSTTGTVSLWDNDLTTTGDLTATDGTFSGSVTVGTNLSLSSGSITDASGALSFGATNLTTTGTLASGQLTVSSDLVLAVGSITSASGALSFGSNNLTTSGTLQAGAGTLTSLSVGSLYLSTTTLTVSQLNGNLSLSGNGTGKVQILSPLDTGNITATGDISATGQLEAGNLRISGNALQAKNLNGDVQLVPSGTGKVVASASVVPNANNTLDLGSSGAAFKKAWVQGSIGGSTEITVADLLTLRSVPYRDVSRTVAAQSGDTLFWDATNGVWLANHPDTEIAHNEVSGLTTGDAGHTQFPMLVGRAGGQTIHGGIAASESLTLKSTSDAVKGSIYLKDTAYFGGSVIPETAASFSGTWSGLDLGTASLPFRDVHLRGEAKGFRFENFTSATLPSASATSVGRTVYASDTKKLYMDTGGSWLVAGVGKYIADQSFNGVITTLTVTVSASISDARNAMWSLLDNANNYDRIYAAIEAISSTQVRITTNVPLPAGSYRLIGLE